MIQMILLRMWRERRLMLILFIGLCLVTSFLALGPLYVRAIAAAEFETRFDSARSSSLRIDLTNDLPIDPAIQETVDATLGARVQSSRAYFSSAGAVCGFEYNPENPEVFGALTTTTGCYFAYAYPELDRLFEVVEGRWPQSGASPGHVEAVITATMQEDSGWQLGKTLIYGEDTDSAIFVEIVGIVAPTLPQDDPFWTGQFIFEEFTFFFTSIDSRQERSFIFAEADYLDSVRAAQERTQFNWRIVIDRTAISAGEIPAIERELSGFTATVREMYPAMEISSLLDDLLLRFQESVAATQPPITFLSLMVLVLLLYNMVTIAGLIQEQQMQEWVMFASRGGSRLQLLGIQFVTVGMLTLVAVLIGPLFAAVLLFVLTVVGPQAAILDPSHIGRLSQDVLLLSLAAGVALQIALMLPAWQGANDSLLRLKRAATRPEQAIWLRYGVDFVLMAAGFVLLLRLYGLATGANLLTLLRDPAGLLRTLVEGNIGILLSDPFNLAAPVLLVLGLTLFWMRLFPMLVGLLGRMIEGRTDLLLRLALWSIERDPGHYTRMVLLLIGTLALGTASLVLSATRETGAWEQAQNLVGADVAVTIAPDATESDWRRISGVRASTSVVLLEPEAPADSILIGIQGESSDGFPVVQEVSSLVTEPDYDMGGLQLPDNLTELRVDVHAEAPEEDGAAPIRTSLDVLLKDRAGRSLRLTLNADNPQQAETYLTYRAALPASAEAPLVFQRFSLTSEQDGQDTLRHTIYLDNFRGVSADGEEVLLLGFEPDTLDQWSWLSSRQGLPSVTLTENDQFFTEGRHSLRVRYVVQRTGAQINAAQLGYRNVRLAPIPVVLSPEMAVALGRRTRDASPLQVGDTGAFTFDVLSPQLGLVQVDVEAVVVDIREAFNAVEPDGLFLIADRDLLLRQINAGAGASLGVRADTVWLDLTGREPSGETTSQLNALSGVEAVVYAWDVYNQFLRAPLPNAISGVFFAGFWVSLLLSLMDFSFYLSVTLRQRASSFATLRALGWSQRRLPQLLLVEQALFVAPALIIGVLVGLLLAGLIFPFLALAGTQTLQLPIFSILLLLLIIVISFAGMLQLTATSLRKLKLTQIMRFGD